MTMKSVLTTLAISVVGLTALGRMIIALRSGGRLAWKARGIGVTAAILVYCWASWLIDERQLVIIAAAVVGIAAGWAAWIISTAQQTNASLFGLLKDIVVPVSLQVAVAIFGAAWALVNQIHEHTAAEIQKKAELLREIVASHDRPDIAYLSAVGDGYVLHLHRYQQLAAMIKTNNDQKCLDELRFEEYANYFFYGLFREGFTEFHAVKGYELYPRLWMEEVFFKLVNNVITNSLGAPVSDAHLRGEEEAALYKYFRPAFSATTEHQGNASDSPALFNFYLLLSSNIIPSGMETNKDYAAMTDELRTGFTNYQQRLTKDQINIGEIFTACDALVGIDDYAFNALFADWYKYGTKGGTLGKDKELPAYLSEDCKSPPKDFLSYPRSNFEGPASEWPERRTNAWQLVRRLVADNFKS
jgi:hypothetical protein